MKKLLALFLSAIMTLSCLMLCVGADQNAAESSDPVVLISRMEKYEKYNHSIYRRGSKGYSREYCDFDILWYTSQKFSLPKDFYEYFVPEAIKNGMPKLFHITKYYNYTRDTFDKAIRQFLADRGAPYTSTITDAIYSGNDRTVIETLMFPDQVLDMDIYNSTGPKARDISKLSEVGDIGADYPMLRTPNEIVNEPLEKLDGWGYSDKYWLDYYDYIQYLNNKYPTSHDAYLANDVTGSAAILDDEGRAELSRRIDIYRSRVEGSPSTGDGTASRAAVFTAGAVLAAAIPALILTVKHRKKEE